MLIVQSKNSFIRCTNKYGYITNQLTRLDRVYNDTGAIFLRHISRIPKDYSSLLREIEDEFEEVESSILDSDLKEFLIDLEGNGFIVFGKSEEEIRTKDKEFTYSITIPKTIAETFQQKTINPIKESTEDFFKEETQGSPIISSLQLELSSNCNERCIHCYIPNKKKDKGSEMPVETVYEIIEQFSSMGGIHITLSGGEALLHPDLINICRFCRDKDLKITILSNLIALKDADIAELKKLNISLIQTSLYSMDPEIHDKITKVKGSFIRTKNAIEKLIKADIPLQISCPLMQANYAGYKEVLDYAKSLKVKAMTDYIMMAQSDCSDENLENRLTLQQTEEVIRTILEHDLDYRAITLNQKAYSDDVSLNLKDFENQPLCGVGYDNCCITSNGDVYPCAGWQGLVLGNIYKNSLKEIWEESVSVKELRTIKQKDFPECLKCEAIDYCNRCLVRNFNECNGDMMKVPKHFCDVAFLNKKIVEEFDEKYSENVYLS